jgi:hypothetical protein
MHAIVYTIHIVIRSCPTLAQRLLMHRSQAQAVVRMSVFIIVFISQE